GRDHRGRGLHSLGGRAGILLVDGGESLNTTDTKDTTSPDATSTRASGTGPAAVSDAGSGTRDAGRQAPSPIIVHAILAIVAIYFLVPVYWVVVNATKSTEDLFGTNGFWFGENFQLLDNLKAVLSANGGIFPRWALNSVIY